MSTDPMSDDVRPDYDSGATAAVSGKRAPSGPEASPRWRRRKEARPGELLDAALEVFVEQGYAATKLEQIARRAGVTKGTMYLYFESKEALFKAMVRVHVVQGIADAETLVQSFEGSARDMLVALMENWWARVVESHRSALAKLVVSEVGQFPDLARFYHEEVISRSMKLFEHVLRLGMARGEFRRVDPALSVRLVIAPMLMAALWKHSFGACVADERFELKHFFEAHVDLMLHGLLTQDSREVHP
jgi:AcrR family transcriptional regulator